MKTDLFDFILPESQIAQIPAKQRSKSKLMVYDRKNDITEHRRFFNIVEYFNPGDLLIRNSSKVIPARLFTLPQDSTQKKCEILFVKLLDEYRFEAMVKPGKKFKLGRKHTLPEGIEVEVESITPDGLRVLKIIGCNDIIPFFQKYGEMPLPPYITSRESEPERYQTVYSDQEGSVAAPTAGLHFENKIFDALEQKGVKIADVILHVGLGTFKPIETEFLEEHKMHEETYYISDEVSNTFLETKKSGNKVWACGTTSVRTLESAIQPDGKLLTGWQTTDCFIKPGYKFKAVDHFITNFHLPKSTLIVLVASFCNRQKILELYQEAVDKDYRFYSFGDSMVII